MKLDFLFCATSFGYGPASKALAIARRIGRNSGCLGFVGEGVALELARRSGVFDRIITSPPTSPEARQAIAQAKVVCCVMDPDFARLSRDEGTLLHVVDSLFWMWHSPPPEFLAADRYWVQDFFGVTARAQETVPAPTVVGPILASTQEGRGRAGWVVNLGGGQSPFGSLVDEVAYLETVLEPVLNASDQLRVPSLVVLSGQRVIEWCRLRWRRSACRFESVSQEEATRLFAGAALVLTSPGLTTTLECLRLRVPTFFLPPQNYSQWWILTYLRSAHVAPEAVHWSDMIASPEIRERMDEAEGVTRVRQAICRAAAQPDAARQILDALMRFNGRDLGDVLAAQQHLVSTWNSHGDGATRIAEALVQFSR